MNNRRLLVAALIVVAVAAIGLIVITQVLPGLTQAQTAGTPAITSQFGDIKTRVKTAAPTSTTSMFNERTNDSVAFIAYRTEPQQAVTLAQFQFKSCTEDRGATPTPEGAPAQATAAPTLEPAATAAAVGEPDFIVLRIVGEESEACYQVGEVFFNQNNRFNLAVGVSNAINGEIAIDRANVANSKIGEIAVDISQLRSDEFMRDGRIRRQWLESNKYPVAKLTDAKTVGLPARPYKDGEVLNFKVVGMLQIRDVKKEITFNTTASLRGDTLTGTATTDFKMTDFGFDPPSIAGMLKADNAVHLIFNFVAREPSEDAATPAK